MHDVEIGREVVDRVLARRRRYHLFDSLDPAKTAFAIVDMQNAFCAEGAPAEVPAARGICAALNAFTRELRGLGAAVVWITHANTVTVDAGDGARSDWDNFFDLFVAADLRRRTIESLAPGGEGQRVYAPLKVAESDLRVTKNRYSALAPGASPLERILRGYGIENLLVGGTKTNVCCESTARDAMMRDFRVVMVSDCLAALSDGEHLAALETFIQQFGDVMTSAEALAALRAGAG